MDNIIYWIWLQRRLGYGSRAVSYVIDLADGAHQIYDYSEEQLRETGAFSEKSICSLADKDLTYAKEVYESCKRLCYDIITPDDRRYPARLMNIASPPAVLYIQGTLPDIDNEVCIGIVGTRNASEHGSLAARELGMRLSQAGCVIISGGAKGIDTCAHTGAIVANGRTVSVLGCGIDYRYNMDNRPLRDRIAKTCALVSEFPPGTAPLARHFPIRNRIISGLSLGVVVVEGSIHSGSVITADLANEQGRDVFAIPGKLGAINSQCVNKLLQQGAKPLTSPLDLLLEYAPHFPHKLKLEGAEVPLLAGCGELCDDVQVQEDAPVLEPNKSNKKESSESADECEAIGCADERRLPPEESAALLSDGARKLYAAITENPEQADELARKTDLSISETLRMLTELEMLGLVRSYPGQRFSR